MGIIKKVVRRAAVRKEKRMVKAHAQKEAMAYKSLVPEHIDRGEASQTIFDQAKRYLTKVHGKRCIVCEMRGEDPTEHYADNHIESHHWFEWCKANVDNMEHVEVVLRALSPFLHGLAIMSYKNPNWKAELLSGKRPPSLWELPEWKGHPFVSLDDPRNQFFLCHAHHQQATKEWASEGYDVIGLHHIPITEWIQYMVLPKGVFPVAHDDGYFKVTKLDGKVHHKE